MGNLQVIPADDFPSSPYYTVVVCVSPAGMPTLLAMGVFYYNYMIKANASDCSFPLYIYIIISLQQILKTRGTMPFSSEICTYICTCHNFFPLSSVQIIIIPACCLLCVL